MWQAAIGQKSALTSTTKRDKPGLIEMDCQASQEQCKSSPHISCFIEKSVKYIGQKAEDACLCLLHTQTIFTHSQISDKVEYKMVIRSQLSLIA